MICCRRQRSGEFLHTMLPARPRAYGYCKFEPKSASVISKEIILTPGTDSALGTPTVPRVVIYYCGPGLYPTYSMVCRAAPATLLGVFGSISAQKWRLLPLDLPSGCTGYRNKSKDSIIFEKQNGKNKRRARALTAPRISWDFLWNFF